MTPEDEVTRWRRDPVAFINEVLVDPESGDQPFVLYPAQVRFLRAAFTLGAGGRLPFPEMVYGCPKKSGKSATAAMAMLYTIVVLGGRHAEGYCVANDLEQAQGRVFAAIVRMIEASPRLRDAAKVTASQVEFTSTGATITALASRAATVAGANPVLVCFDELWAYQTEAARRLFDEMVPSPARRVSGRLTTTYAGFSGESELLEELYTRGLRGRRIAPSLYRQRGLLCFWSHKPIAPWQTRAWLSQMRGQLRPNAYLRMIENRFVTSESTFVEPEWWSACEDPELHPLVANSTIPVWVGVDASVKRDATAIVVCTWDAERKRVRLVAHRVFQPTPREPLDFEATVEATLLDLRDRFDVREVKFDPYQLVAVAQRLSTQAGLPMVEFPQSVPNLTEASTNLYELIKGGNLHVYVDDGLRLAVHRAVAVETSRGWKISKRAASHRIDLVVALAQAALGATKMGQVSEPGYVGTANLGHDARVRSALSDADREEIRGYERERREWARDEFRRELNLAGDGPGMAVYGSGWGTRRW